MASVRPKPALVPRPTAGGTDAAQQPASSRLEKAPAIATPERSDWSRYADLSPAELPAPGQVAESRAEAGLGLLSFRVQEVLQSKTPAFDSVEAAARQQIERFGLHTRTQAVDVQAADKKLPAAVQDAATFFAAQVEEPGWGEVRVLEATVGAHLDEVLLVHAKTHAGFGYLEVYDKAGAPLMSGTTERARVDGWDESFGKVRDVAQMLAP